MTCASCAAEVVSLAMTYVYGSRQIRASARGDRPGIGSDRESSPIVPGYSETTRPVASRGSKAATWRPFATPRYTPSGFRFRRRKAWGLPAAPPKGDKSLLVHSPCSCSRRTFAFLSRQPMRLYGEEWRAMGEAYSTDHSSSGQRLGQRAAQTAPNRERMKKASRSVRETKVPRRPRFLRASRRRTASLSKKYLRTLSFSCTSLASRRARGLASSARESAPRKAPSSPAKNEGKLSASSGGAA